MGVIIKDKKLVIITEKKNFFLLHVEKCKTTQYKNNKRKIINPASNVEFELPYGSYLMSNIQDYIKYIGVIHLVRGKIFKKTNNSQPLVCTRVCIRG